MLKRQPAAASVQTTTKRSKVQKRVPKALLPRLIKIHTVPRKFKLPRCGEARSI